MEKLLKRYHAGQLLDKELSERTRYDVKRVLDHDFDTICVDGFFPDLIAQFLQKHRISCKVDVLEAYRFLEDIYFKEDSTLVPATPPVISAVERIRIENSSDSELKDIIKRCNMHMKAQKELVVEQRYRNFRMKRAAYLELDRRNPPLPTESPPPTESPLPPLPPGSPPPIPPPAVDSPPPPPPQRPPRREHTPPWMYRLNQIPSPPPTPPHIRNAFRDHHWYKDR